MQQLRHSKDRLFKNRSLKHTTMPDPYQATNSPSPLHYQLQKDSFSQLQTSMNGFTYTRLDHTDPPIFWNKNTNLWNNNQIPGGTNSRLSCWASRLDLFTSCSLLSLMVQVQPKGLSSPALLQCTIKFNLYYYYYYVIISKSGISFNSFNEHRYSPSKIMTIVPRIWTIHQSQLEGTPSYQQQDTRWIMNKVTEKSKHFFDFSTMIANNKAL